MADNSDFKVSNAQAPGGGGANGDLVKGVENGGALGCGGGQSKGRRPYVKPAISSSQAFERGALAGCGVVMADFPCNGLS